MKNATNTKIAELLLSQTYAERMEIASYMFDAINDWGDGGAREDMASLLQGWAENELDGMGEQQ